MLLFHRQEEPMDDDVSESNVSESDMSNSDASESEDDTDKESVDSEGTVESEPEDETDNSMNFWSRIIREVWNQESYGVETLAEVLKEPYLSEFINDVQKLFEGRLEFAQHMENDDEVYDKIKKTIDRYESKGYDTQEATELAWQERRFLLRNIIEECVKNLVDEEEEGDDENVDDETEDTDDGIADDSDQTITEFR